MEIQRGKEVMSMAEYAQHMLKTAACTMRLMKYSKKRGEEECEDDDGETRAQTSTNNKTMTYLGDSWFGSIHSVLGAVSLGDNLICIIKTCHGGTPKRFIEDKMSNWPAGSTLALQATVRGVDLVCLGYKYSKTKILTFLFNKGAGSLKPGDPYIARWKDKHMNTVSKLVPRPKVVSTYFKDCNKIDSHNQSRQSDLALEKAWGGD